jgi:hypothetical protein
MKYPHLLIKFSVIDFGVLGIIGPYYFFMPTEAIITSTAIANMNTSKVTSNTRLESPVFLSFRYFTATQSRIVSQIIDIMRPTIIIVLLIK